MCCRGPCAHVPHLTCSVTKSFTGTLAATFAAEGQLDVKAPVTEYVPELAASGWGTATVRQVMDMTTALVYSEDYTRADAEVWQHLRGGGWYNGRQIVPEAAIADIVAGGLASDFAQGGYPLLPGWSYRNMWWMSHNAHGAYTARGIHGQAIYIDPVAEMVIARFASHPRAANANLDPTSLPAYDALAKSLMGHG